MSGIDPEGVSWAWGGRLSEDLMLHLMHVNPSVTESSGWSGTVSPDGSRCQKAQIQPRGGAVLLALLSFC